jgi:hypothetical protein
LAKNGEVEEQKNWTLKSIFERLNSAIIGNDNYNKTLALSIADFLGESKIRNHLLVSWPSGTGKKYFLTQGLPNLKIPSHMIGDANKFLNPNSPRYTSQGAHRFANMIITLFERNPLYWVLIGTWDFLQGGDKSLDEKVSNLNGPEFGTRVDYDWKLPAWSLETLFEAIKASIPNCKVTCDDLSLT